MPPVTNTVFAPCPRCKQVHEVDESKKMQTCPYCEAKWPREKNVNG
jgi:phage FluMu protein Com